MSIIMSSVENSTSIKANKKKCSSGEETNNNAALTKVIPIPTKVVEVGKAATESAQPFADQFDIILFTPEYTQQVATALAVVFASEEPLCIATKTNPINYFAFSMLYAQQCAANGNSMIAVDKNSRMVVGFHLCHEYDSWEEPDSTDPGIVVQGELIDSLHALHRNQKHENVSANSCESQGSPRASSPHQENKTGEKKGKTLKVCSAGVYAFARRMRLATKMLEKNMEHARQQGFTQMLVECTGAFSQQLYKSYGFEEVARIYYSEYEVEVNVSGEKVKVRPFETIPSPHTNISLSLRQL
jgi:ribosomal protein S18 acetylase RimI-like enzyme